MPTESNIEVLKGRQAARATLTDGYDDISGGVVASMQTPSGDAQSATLYLASESAVSVTVEFSPDSGESWYEPAAESPVEIDGTEIVHIDYAASHVRVTAKNGATTGVRAALRVVA